ncbi:MAG: LamG-like jellyroll fold domain-containing protein [Planctomycetota bacterium]
MNLGPPINSPVGDDGVSISSDGLSLYFSTVPPGLSGVEDLYVATRATTDDDWGNPVNLGPTVNSSADDCYLSISADELELYFTANRGGGYGSYDLWVTRRETIYDPWGTPVNLGPTVNSSSGEGQPGISADGRMLFFVTDRSGGYGQTDIWVTSRATTDDPWGEPVNLGSTVNSSAWEEYPNVSADGSTLHFRYSQSGRRSGGDIWQAPIIPIVDFNGDEIVDAADMSIMVDYWGTDEPLCDIGPMPWGDGIVDVEDLIVLAEHLFEEILPPELVAYWKFDETEGDIAYDSAAVNDAVVFGGVVWQPADGAVDGALEFDGMDDYVSTPYVLNPADGPFSVFAWIKGGAPGQVIISQTDGLNWLSADPAEGNLMTQLRFIGGRVVQQALLSQTVITDGQWHRVGFVWDGAYRALYVDDTLVAEDSQPGLADSLGGLNIGCGSDLTAGTFFSGLIDDVRIYNRAVRP